MWGLKMNENNFILELLKYGIDPGIICFNNNARDDAFCVRDNYSIVEVFYRERGKEYDLRKFPNRELALEYLLNKILSISGKQKID